MKSDAMNNLYTLRPPSHRGEDSEILRSLAKPAPLQLADDGPIEKDPNDIFEIDVILRFHKLFHRSSSSGTRQQSISEAEFKKVLREFTPHEHVIENIYRKIDASCEGFVTFSGFTTFLITADAGENYAALVLS